MVVSILLKIALGALCELLMYVFQLFLEEGVFSDDLKIANVTLICKAGENKDI